MKHRTSVYLAGPMNHAEDHGRQWREELIDRDGTFNFLNPLDVNDEHEFDPDEPTPTWIIDEDLDMIEEADAVLAYLPFKKPSRGTAVEIWEAGKDPDTHVVVWTDVPKDELSPFVRGPADDFSDSIGGALEKIIPEPTSGDPDE